MEMICVKLLPVVGGTSCNLTLGKKYNVVTIPTPPNEGDEMREPSNPQVFVFGDNLKSEYVYPMSAFVTVDEWRDIRLNDLIDFI